MSTSTNGPDETTRSELQRIATHIAARAQHPATGRIGLRVSPGGFGSISYGDGNTRLRMSGTTLIWESSTSKSARGISVEGATLRQLADFADVDLSTEFSAGSDTPPVGDVDAPLVLDPDGADQIAAWFDLTARALDVVVGTAPPWSDASIPQLWPEHFDVAIDLAFDPAAPSERRVNLGGSTGDADHPVPYLYIGPWTTERPGDPAFWNAPFGAVLDADHVDSADDRLSAAVEFFRSGLSMLTP